MAPSTIATPISSVTGFHFKHSRGRIAPKTTTTKICVHKPTIQSVASSSSSSLGTSTVVRRSGNYRPAIWDNDYLQSLRNNYRGADTYKNQAENLKEKVRNWINNASANPLDQLELIDNLQRLGLSYHYNSEINNALQNIYNSNDDRWKKGNLHATSLEFRLFRQHYYDVSEEVFNNFKDNTGQFKVDDINAMLSLYEASYYGLEGENIMEEAWDFATKNLENLNDDVEVNLAMQVKHALEFPLHWRMSRSEARWYIDVYERKDDMNRVLLEFAKLDFNIVQGIYQEELNNLSRWWKNIGLVGKNAKLSFARDRLVESFVWSVGITFEPQYAHCREIVTKTIALINVIDDVYDVYGTLEELELFTDVVERWDINAMEELPEYIKLCFLALFNFVNEMAYDILKEQGLDLAMNIKNQWVEFLQSYMVEARWYYSEYTPTLKEFMNNGWISIACIITCYQAFLSASKPIIEKELEFLETKPEILYCASMAMRYEDDLGTSSYELKRGDVPKSIQCYMHETGASEEDARAHIKGLIRKMCKKANAYRGSNPPLSPTFTEIILNLVRVSNYLYQYGDGHGVLNGETIDMTKLLLFEPIQM